MYCNLRFLISQISIPFSHSFIIISANDYLNLSHNNLTVSLSFSENSSKSLNTITSSCKKRTRSNIIFPLLISIQTPGVFLSLSLIHILSPAAFFFQHLDSGFICHSEAAPEQFPMKVIIHWLKVML